MVENTGVIFELFFTDDLVGSVGLLFFMVSALASFISVDIMAS